MSLAWPSIVTRTHAELASLPMAVNALQPGPLEPTNEPYAIAKIAGIKLCESYSRQYGKSHGVDYRSIPSPRGLLSEHQAAVTSVADWARSFCELSA